METSDSKLIAFNNTYKKLLKENREVPPKKRERLKLTDIWNEIDKQAEEKKAQAEERIAQREARRKARLEARREARKAERREQRGY